MTAPPLPFAPAQGSDGLPLVHELSPPPDVEAAFLRFSRRRDCLFLDSALRHASLGRYSYLAAEPIDRFVVHAGESTAVFPALAARLARYTAAAIPGLPPFQGGWAGLLSYDLHRQLENIPAPGYDEFAAPLAALACYDTVLAFDHVEHRVWIVSHGLSEQGSETEDNLPQRRARAAARISKYERWLHEPVGPLPPTPSPRNVLAAPQLAPQYAVPGPAGLTSNFSHEGYLAAVKRCIEYIYAGDIFQVNFAQRLLYPAVDDSPSLYLRLRNRNPATFSAYFDCGEVQVVSASPERFLSVYRGTVEARPIKGTRRRSPWPEADLFTGDELLASDKDRAENVMIVDLLRNDLAQVCLADSIRVTKLCGLETYQFVQHLVSVVEGKLRPDCQPLDAVRSAFPGGSITGAPKVRAMGIIAELEPTARGPYCGSLGYIGFEGSVDFNILIRTITASRGWWQLPVGGGIVAQSDPQREYEETWHKAEGMLRSLLE
jgi:para-aminobenzoate synthetase component 1